MRKNKMTKNKCHKKTLLILSLKLNISKLYETHENFVYGNMSFFVVVIVVFVVYVFDELLIHQRHFILMVACCAL